MRKRARKRKAASNLLGRSGNNVQERIDKMKKLTARLKRAKPEKVIDIRLKLREAPRRAIDEITAFAMGFRNRNRMNELTPKDRWKVYSQSIDNKA